MHVVGRGERAERVAQLGVRLERQRVLALRPVELNGGDGTVHPPEKVLGLERRHLRHASPSQSLRNALSLAESCSASRIETPPSSSSTQRSWAAAMSANAVRPLRVRLMNEVRRSPLRWARTTKPSDTSRSTMPVTLPFDTIRKREISLISMPSGLR